MPLGKPLANTPLERQIRHTDLGEASQNASGPVAQAVQGGSQVEANSHATLPTIRLGDTYHEQASTKRPTDLISDSSDEEPTEPCLAFDKDEDLLSDSDIESMASDSYCTIPDEIREAERNSEGQGKVAASYYATDRRFRGFLNSLCRETDTEEAEQHTREGLPYAVETAQSLRLNRPLTDNPLQLYAFAFVIQIWQLACLRLQHGVNPSDDRLDTLSSLMGTYFLSAYTILRPHCQIPLMELNIVVECWEERLKELDNGNAWLERGWATDIVGVDHDPTPSQNNTSAGYIRSLKDLGTIGLAMKVIEVEKTNQKGEETQLREMARLDRTETLSKLGMMLVSMAPPLLRAIIQGQLPRKAKLPSSEVSHALDKIREADPGQPGIYMNSLVDAMGLSPSPAQWSKACNHMLMYVQRDMEHNDMAANIDQQIYPNPLWPRDLAGKGLRRYMDWRTYIEKGSHELNGSRRQWVKFFVAELEGRCAGQIKHGPLSVGICNIGFSNNIDKRLWQHRHHESSNYLMNLTEAIFEFLYPQMFYIQQYVIYNCFQPVQTWMAGIVFTQLAQGYVEGGGGFSHEPAGRSNGSSFQALTEEQWEILEHEAQSDIDPRMREEDVAMAQRISRGKAKQEAQLRLAQARIELVRLDTRRLKIEAEMIQMGRRNN